MRESTLYFHGGAGRVTGSNFLLDTGEGKLLVDCGLIQGTGDEKNWEPFAYDPKSISHLIISHAHLDHIGRIPRLVREGFSGEIISTKATRALAEPLLMDALAIMGRRAEKQGKEELYVEEDVKKALHLWRGIGYHEKVSLPDDVALELFDAGHILGSSIIRLERGDRSIVFSGDLGGGNSPLLKATEDVTASYLVMEGTYGDKTRPEDAERFSKLEDIIEDSMTRGGTLLIPAFSTERTQDLLFDIRRLMTEKRIPSVPVYLDSPLAEKVTHAYMTHPEYFSDEIRKRVEGGEDIFSFPGLHLAVQPEASRKLDESREQKILLAGSGMSSGGRVLSHERHYLPDPKSTILIVGYQAAGTLGRQLIEGAKYLELYKEKIPVRAKVVTMYGYSAHRDGEGLLEFANKTAQDADGVFIVHAEPAAAAFLTQRIRDYLSVRATAPEEGESVVLTF
jgi:metallo-beta-lactamase family protein